LSLTYGIRCSILEIGSGWGTIRIAAFFAAAPPSAGRSIHLKEREKTMRVFESRSDISQFMQKLRWKWMDFSNGIVRVVGTEPIQMSQEEMREKLRAYNQRERSRERSQL
jgi:hypothetical protein